MEKDLQQYAERKMPLFNLIVSIWQHNIVLVNTIGVGFTKSVFTYKNGTCILNASKSEIDLISNQILKLINSESADFKVWYERAKILNKKADDLIFKYQTGEIKLDSDSYQEVFELFVDNFGFCTIVPYWILYAINLELENGRSRDSFAEVLEMFEELKNETRYPQLVKNVITKYFIKASEIINVSLELVTCIHPSELGKIMRGDIDITKEELLKRMNGCSISLGKNPYEVNFTYSTETGFSNIAYSHNNINELKGSIAFKGIVKGKVRIINTIDDMSKFEDGDIIVSIQSSPALMPAILKCCAIITDEGGIMCHASVISRELKKPCVIGTKIATKVLKDGDLVEVDADNGMVRIIK